MGVEIGDFVSIRAINQNGKSSWVENDLEFCAILKSGLRSNPNYLPPGHPDRSFPEKEPMWLPNEYLVVRYSDRYSTAKKTELYRGTDKAEANRIFDLATAEYKSSHGGYRPGSGRPSELEKAKLISFDCPQDLRERLDAEAKRQGKKKAELIRELLEQGLR
jgi:hypothetical protein